MSKTSKTIELEYPVDFHGAEVAQLVMRRPKVKDMLLADKQSGSAPEGEVELFANLCEVDPDVIKELDQLDYQELQQAYLGFLESPKTRGKKTK